MSVLVIEHEPALAQSLTHGLTAGGHRVKTVHDGPAGQAIAVRDTVELVILERRPHCDGLEVLNAICHAKPGLPVLILTARADARDCVACLDSGAVDYLVKPVSLEEITARVRAHLRAARAAESTCLQVGDIELDRDSRLARRAGQEIRLSAREYDLLLYFMRHPGLVLSRKQLHFGVWGYNFDPGTNVAEVYVGYLRRKLKAPSPIKTVRSKGYCLSGLCT